MILQPKPVEIPKMLDANEHTVLLAYIWLQHQLYIYVVELEVS